MLNILQKSGFTLLEVMISLTLSLILLISLYEIFTSINQSYHYVQGLATIEENGQLASFLLAREIGQSGYSGCRKVDNNFSIQLHTSNLVSSNLLIHGYDSNHLPAEAKSLAKSIVANSSVVAVQFMSTKTAYLTASIKRPSLSLKIDNTALFKINDEILVTDCVHADLVIIKNIQNNHIEINAPLNSYDIGTKVGLWKNEWFYVGKTGRLNKKGYPITALYVFQPNGRDEELVENVADFHAKYGYLNATQQLTFSSSATIPNWSQVKAVQLFLLLQSSNAILSHPQSVIFDGANWNTLDNQLYRQWEITVSLLNR